MTKEQYLAFHKNCCERMITTTLAKNSDYTGTSPDPFANFRLVEAAGICTTEQGFLTRMSDKLSRTTSFVQKGTLLVQDETVEDTLIDLANYCILFAGYIKSKKHDEIEEQKRSGTPQGPGEDVKVRSSALKEAAW
jgi:hypothetical protein